VPGGCWFAGEVVEPDSFSLIGCTVSPGFDFDDFELKSRSELTALFPDLKEVIAGLTHH
jgi:predicted cupin superfamily sugar epimerase